MDGEYNNWCAVAAFFDGDGWVSASPQKDILAIRLGFVDNWLPQTRQLQAFIHSQGITTTRIWKMKANAYCFLVSSQSSVVKAATMMLDARGCLYKKRDELKWVLQYFDDEITGTQFINNLNEEVRRGNRTGKIRIVDIPFVHAEGSRQRYLRSATTRRVLTDEQKRQIVIDRGSPEMTLARLAEKYGVSITTIARAVGNRRD